MVRIDMSEYMEKHSVARLIGAPPGYVGYEEGGALTEAVRRRPYQVILFDEIEKAHPDVFNVLLQVLDDGRLTDGQGRTVDFRNTLIIMTSNLGAEYLVNLKETEDVDIVRDAGDGGGARALPAGVPQPARRDHPVPPAEARARWATIVEIQLERLKKLLDERKITLELDAAARNWLAEKGYDPAYGARPLKRVIQKQLQDPLAEKILLGEIRDGDASRSPPAPTGCSSARNTSVHRRKRRDAAGRRPPTRSSARGAAARHVWYSRSVEREPDVARFLAQGMRLSGARFFEISPSIGIPARHCRPR